MNRAPRTLRVSPRSIGWISAAAGLAAVWIILWTTNPFSGGASRSTSTPAETFTATPLVLHPPKDTAVISIPPVPPGTAALTAVNLADLAEMGRFGRGWPASLDFSPDGSCAAAGTAWGVEILRTTDWQGRLRIPLSSPVLAVLFSPDGSQLAAGLQDGTVLTIDAETGKTVRRFSSHSRPVRGLAFSAAAAGKIPTMLASGAEDGSVVVWDLESGMALRQFKNPLLGYWGYGIRSLAFAPDNKILVTGGDQGYLSRWNLETGEELPRLQTQHGLMFGIAFSPDGKRLASACGEGTVQIWDFVSEKPLALLTGHAYGAWSVAWTRDGKQLAVGAGDGTVKIWDPESGTLRREQAVAFTKLDLVRLSPDDSLLGAVSGGERAFVLDFHSLAEVYSFPEFVSGLRSAEFSPDGKWALLSGENGQAYVWDLPQGKVYVVGDMRPASNADISAVFSPAGDVLALADGLPGVLRWFDAPTLSPRSEIRMPGLRAIAFSPDGRYLAAGGNGELILRELATGASKQVNIPSRMTSLAFLRISGGQQTILAGGSEDGSIGLWDPDSMEQTSVLSAEGNPPVWTLASNGSLLAAGDDQGNVQIWDVADGKILRRFYGYSGAIFSLAISPDGSLVAAGGMQGSLRFWSIASGTLLQLVHAHNGWVYGLDFSPDGRWVLSTGADGTGRIWGIPDER